MRSLKNYFPGLVHDESSEECIMNRIELNFIEPWIESICMPEEDTP